MPTVELPPAVPFTAQVTAVFVELETVAENWKVCPTFKDEVTDPKAMATAGGVDGGGVVPPPPQPTTAITASKLNPIPRTDSLRRWPCFIDPAPIKSNFRFDVCDIAATCTTISARNGLVGVANDSPFRACREKK